MTLRTQKALFWLAAFTLFVLFVGQVSEILLPFVVGILVAYFLDPAADRLQAAGFSRTWSTAIITGSFFAVVAVVLALLAPILYDQLTALISNIPQYIDAFQQQYGEKIQRWFSSVRESALPEGVQEKVVGASQAQAVLQYSAKFAAGVLESGVAFLNLLSLVFISPVVAFFMLRDFDRLTARVDSWLPREHAATIRDLLRQMDSMLSAFIRGVSNVCLSMAAFYGIGFSLIGLDFGLLVGLGTGLATFIPFVGPLTGYTIAMLLAYFQFNADLMSLGLVGLVCGLGQLIESNFLTPMLVGNKVNLHPLWVIFGLLAGGSLFGFVGILLAVPVTAVIGVLARFAIGEYMKSEFYKGRSRAKAKA